MHVRSNWVGYSGSGLCYSVPRAFTTPPSGTPPKVGGEFYACHRIPPAPKTLLRSEDLRASAPMLFLLRQSGNWLFGSCVGRFATSMHSICEE